MRYYPFEEHNRTDPPTQYDYYFFEKNLQGDIVGIYNEDGIKVLGFVYDAWGNHSIEYTTYMPQNSEATRFVLEACIFRYRGYVYDVETGLYYLQSRYYDPQTGRFISADGYVNANDDIIGFNMFAYCSNNPVMFVDPDGESILFALFISVYVITAVVVLYHLLMPEEVKENFTKDPDEYSVEVEAGHGWGLGFEIDEHIGIDYNQDKTTIWNFKNKLKTTNKQSFEIGAGITWGFEQEYRYRDGSKFLLNREAPVYNVSVLGFSIKDNDITWGTGFSAHMFYGGHIGTEINVSNIVRKANKKVNSIKEFFGW